MSIKSWKAEERDAREYFNYGEDWISSSKMSDHKFCNGLFAMNWLLVGEKSTNKKMRLGNRVHTVIYWFYQTILKSEEDAIEILSDAVSNISLNANRKDYVKSLFEDIIAAILPDGIPSDDVNRLQHFIDEEVERIFELYEYLGTMTASDIRKYFIPLEFEESFIIERLPEQDEEEDNINLMGTLDALFLLPPGYNDGYIYMVRDFKSQIPSDIIKQIKDNEERGPLDKKDLEIPSRYRAQFTFYVDYARIKYEVKRDQILNSLLVLVEDRYLLINEKPKSRSFTARNKYIKKMRKAIDEWFKAKMQAENPNNIVIDDYFKFSPFHRKCEMCSRKDDCKRWQATKRPFPFNKKED